MGRMNCKTIEIIKHFEGLRLEAYKCSGGKWTIGWGNTRYPDGSTVKKGDKIDLEKAEAMLIVEAERVEKEVLKLVRVKLGDDQVSALVSMAYNIGIGSFRDSDTLKFINNGKTLDGVMAIKNWRKSKGEIRKGLIRRRFSEIDLFLGKKRYINRKFKTEYYRSHYKDWKNENWK